MKICVVVVVVVVVRILVRVVVILVLDVVVLAGDIRGMELDVAPVRGGAERRRGSLGVEGRANLGALAVAAPPRPVRGVFLAHAEAEHVRARRAPAAAEHALLVVVAVADVAAMSDGRVLVGAARAVGVGARGFEVLLVQVREHLVSLPFAPAELLLAPSANLEALDASRSTSATPFPPAASVDPRDPSSAPSSGAPSTPDVASPISPRYAAPSPPPSTSGSEALSSSLLISASVGSAAAMTRLRTSSRLLSASSVSAPAITPARAVREHLGELGRAPRL